MNKQGRHELASELAYESIKQSELFDQLDNATCDREADSLTTTIERVIDGWLSHRLAERAEVERIDALTGFTSALGTQLRSLREAQSEREEYA
jgi:hypothetical protein